MDSTTFNRLEFPAVLEHLAAQAVSPAAKTACLETRPWTDPETISRHWDAVMEVLGLLDSGGELPISGFDDCGEILLRLSKPNGVLDPLEWLTVRRFLAVGADVHRAVRGARDRMPVCWARLEMLDPLPELAAEIKRIFDEDGTVRDGASDELRACRARIRRLEKEIESVFSRILSRLGGDDVLQETFQTLRNGRRVVPVRAGARGRLPGIVQDVSNSGETLFVEPLEAIEPTNRLAEEQNHEREIIFRILSELSAEARRHSPSLEFNRDALIQMDLWHARARLAFRHGLHRPHVAPGVAVHLMRAHHPLLFFKDPQRSVPLSMRLSRENRALVITGPNTGGKTTSLKTVGLLALMAQSAIPIPAGVDSRLPVFNQVLAEVGDEQSVSAGLSTFSAHIRRISWILQHCGGGALVLLDELGKATDPLQAGALGRAILEALVERGALTLVTTHLPALKDWAHDSPAGRNASFRLDPNTHRPEYQIHMDTPGISEAFTIALAEGLPKEVVDAAIQNQPPEERALSELLSSLQKKEALLEQTIREAQEAREAAERAQRETLKRRAEVDMRKADMDLNIEKKYKELLDKARQDLEKRIANLPSRQALSQAREQLQRDQQQAEQRIHALLEREERILQAAEPPRRDDEGGGPYEPAVGDWVLIGEGQQGGRIEQIDAARGRAKVLVGTLQVDSALENLRPTLPQPDIAQQAYAGPRYVSSGPVESVPAEIDVHGWRVADALDEVDKYLDKAVLCRLPEVRIVHGHGTGALRNGIHEFLRRHPHARSFRLSDPREGGPAITVVTLK
jgi:DNA mismatch repair protein MutS2